MGIQTSLISPSGYSVDHGLEIALNQFDLSYTGSCNRCRAWTDTNITLDIDNGVVIYWSNSRAISADAPVYELATGHTACCKSSEHQQAFLTKNYNLFPTTLQIGWHTGEKIKFSHVDRVSRADLYDHKEEVILQSLLRQQVTHREMDPKKVKSVQAVAQTDANTARGDWRDKIGKNILGGPMGTRRLLADLGAFGIVAAPVEAVEAIRNSKNDGTDADRERLFDSIQTRLTAEIPATRQLFGPSNSYNYGRELEKGSIDLQNTLKGLWRWQVGGHAQWLMQLHTIQGTQSVGYGSIYLLNGGETGSASVLDVSPAFSKFWDGGSYGSEDQTRFRANLIQGRYLVLGSPAGASIVVYDISSGRVLGLAENIPQSTLLDDVRLSSDLRFIIQVNTDGQFFLHEVATGKLSLSGRYVDDEVILYTKEGYFWSSYEGAHFVYLHFPGLQGNFSFQQFDALLNRPDIVRAQLLEGKEPPHLRLAPPPALDARLLEATDQGDRIFVDARSSTGLTNLRFYQDGRLIRDLPINGVMFKDEVMVPPASHARWLTVLAVDRKGILSVPQALRLQARGPKSNHLRAVLVGVDHYPDARNNLAFAGSDARRLAEAIRGRSNSYYADQDVRVLIDEQATPQSIIAALENTVTAAGENDTILFSFAGHGVQGGDGHYYLTPSGFQVKDISGTGLPWTQIAAILGRAKTRVIVMLDACHSGLSGSEGLTDNDEAAKALLAGSHAPMLVLAASKGRQLASEGPKWGGGVFTYAITKILDAKSGTYDVDGNGAIEVSELYRGLREILSRETGHQQSPWLVRQDLIGDFSVF
jgi:hypothetical protein